MSMPRARTLLVLNTTIIVLSVIFFMLADQKARAGRNVPFEIDGQAPAPVYIVDTQRDVYEEYVKMRLSGARVLQVNRFFNLMKYEPWETRTSKPFPLAAINQREMYEKGLDSHNWLYIAARTGLVRSVVTVLPDSVFKTRFNDLREDPEYSYDPPVFRGYSFDTPRSIVTLGNLFPIMEPVIINIDAGFFVDGTDPEKIVSSIRSSCPDIRAIVLVRSIDEPDIDGKMREHIEKLREILQGFNGQKIF